MDPTKAHSAAEIWHCAPQLTTGEALSLICAGLIIFAFGLLLFAELVTDRRQ